MFSSHLGSPNTFDDSQSDNYKVTLLITIIVSLKTKGGL